MTKPEMKKLLKALLPTYRDLLYLGYPEEVTEPLHRAVRTLKTALYWADPDEERFRKDFPKAKALDDEVDGATPESVRKSSAEKYHGSLVEIHKTIWDKGRKTVIDDDVLNDLEVAVSRLEMDYDPGLKWSVFTD